jgi:hypothetical protein
MIAVWRIPKGWRLLSPIGSGLIRGRVNSKVKTPSEIECDTFCMFRSAPAKYMSLQTPRKK